jgi:hypothetical protein
MSSTTLGGSGHEHYRNWLQNDRIHITIGAVAQIQSIRDYVFDFRPRDLLRDSISQLSTFHLLASGSSLRLRIRTAECRHRAKHALVRMDLNDHCHCFRASTTLADLVYAAILCRDFFGSAGIAEAVA